MTMTGAAAKELELGLLGGIRHRDLQQEAIGLRLGQGIRALELDGVLRRDDEERGPEIVALAVQRDLSLLHGLEERGLRLRRRAVDLVGEQDVGDRKSVV